MSTLFYHGNKKFFIRSNENQHFNNNELPHVHCAAVSGEIKIMLTTGDIKVLKPGIGSHEYRGIREIVRKDKNYTLCWSAWKEQCGPLKPTDDPSGGRWKSNSNYTIR